MLYVESAFMSSPPPLLPPPSSLLPPLLPSSFLCRMSQSIVPLTSPLPWSAMECLKQGRGNSRVWSSLCGPPTMTTLWSGTLLTRSSHSSMSGSQVCDSCHSTVRACPIPLPSAPPLCMLPHPFACLSHTSARCPTPLPAAPPLCLLPYHYPILQV